MEQFNIVTVYRNGFRIGLWALQISINFTDKNKLEIKKLVNEKQKSLEAKFTIIFNQVYHSDYMGCRNAEVFINAIVDSIYY